MPVPRVFASPSDQRGQWPHVVATLLALLTAEHRAALIGELAGEELAGAQDAQVREFRPVGEEVIDIVLHDADKRWVLGVHTSLVFDADSTASLRACHDALASVAERVILLSITPDRGETAALAAAREDGRDIRRKSWQRVRDWVQERPERGQAQGPDLLLLREADYVLNARTAELYRLEELMPLMPESVRAAFATAYFDIDDVHTAPRVTQSEGAWTVGAPRTGEASVELRIAGGALSVALAGDAAGPGFSPAERPGWHHLAIGSDSDYQAARSHVQAALLRILPPKR